MQISRDFPPTPPSWLQSLPLQADLLGVGWHGSLASCSLVALTHGLSSTSEVGLRQKMVQATARASLEGPFSSTRHLRVFSAAPSLTPGGILRPKGGEKSHVRPQGHGARDPWEPWGQGSTCFPQPGLLLSFLLHLLFCCLLQG